MLWSRFFVISFIGFVHGVDQCEDSVSLLQTGSLPKNNTVIESGQHSVLVEKAQLIATATANSNMMMENMDTAVRNACEHRRRGKGKIYDPCNENGQCHDHYEISQQCDQPSVSDGRHIKCDGTKHQCLYIDPCFPSIAKVFCKYRGSIKIDALRQGDMILSVDRTGQPFYDEVSFYSLADNQRKREQFLSVETSSNSILRVTSEHHIPTGPQCCTNLKIAGELRIGDLIWTLGPNQEEAAIPVVVNAIAVSVHDGLHSPVMVHGGYPIVDGIVTSFDNLEAVTMSERWMPFLSKICNAVNGCGPMATLVKMFECHAKGECGDRAIITKANGAEQLFV